jgi:hypothetical protein
MGRNSGGCAGAPEPGRRSNPSPSSRERTPAIQPRQESWAMITVISETTSASAMKKYST